MQLTLKGFEEMDRRMKDIERQLKANTKAAEAMDKGFGKFKQGLADLGAMGGRVFLGLQAGMLAAVAAASPGVFDQFKLAVADTGAVIGQALIPVVREMTGWIREFADWFLNLDDTTKQAVASFVKWGLVLSGVAFVLPKIVGAVMMLGAAIKAMLSPIGLVVVAIAAMAAGFINAAMEQKALNAQSQNMSDAQFAELKLEKLHEADREGRGWRGLWTDFGRNVRVDAAAKDLEEADANRKSLAKLKGKSSHGASQHQTGYEPVDESYRRVQMAVTRAESGKDTDPQVQTVGILKGIAKVIEEALNATRRGAGQGQMVVQP